MDKVYQVVGLRFHVQESLCGELVMVNLFHLVLVFCRREAISQLDKNSFLSPEKLQASGQRVGCSTDHY